MDMKDTKADLCDQSKSYYNSDVFSDFTIKCGNRKWKVHKFVLAVHSDVFKKYCHGTFKESSEGVLDLSEHDELKVETLVYYLYNFKYSYTTPESELDSRFDQGCFHIDMAVIADRYFITGLNDLANDKTNRSIFNTVLDDVGLAMLAIRAYEVPQATKWIRGVLVHNIIKARILESSPAGEVAKAMRHNGDFARTLHSNCRGAIQAHVQAQLRIVGASRRYQDPGLQDRELLAGWRNSTRPPKLAGTKASARDILSKRH